MDASFKLTTQWLHNYSQQMIAVMSGSGGGEEEDGRAAAIE